MDPFQRAELLLNEGVILKATQVDFIFFFLMPFPAGLALFHGSLTFCLCWLILDPPQFQCPPRGLSTQSQAPCDKVRSRFLQQTVQSSLAGLGNPVGCQQEEGEAAQGRPQRNSRAGAQAKCSFPWIPPRAPALQSVSVAISADPNLP